MNMKHHFVYSSHYENKVLEIDTNDDPPGIGEYVQLPFGNNKEMCRYRVISVYYMAGERGQIDYYIEVKPV